jgi:hypothetical protein
MERIIESFEEFNIGKNKSYTPNQFEDDDVYKIISLFDSRFVDFCVGLSGFLNSKAFIEPDYDNEVFVIYLDKSENIRFNEFQYYLYYSPNKGFSVEFNKVGVSDIYDSYSHSEFIGLLFE